MQPKLNDYCSRYFRYLDLIACGKTWEATDLQNMPQQPDSFKAIAKLAQTILDPVVDQYGRITLSFGFCSMELAKQIRNRSKQLKKHPQIAPSLDQHAGHELSRNGVPICDRLGQSCDFLIDGTTADQLAYFISTELEYDRIYYYGKSRPLHVSCAPNGREPAKEIYWLKKNKRGLKTPSKVTPEYLLNDAVE